MLLPFRGKAAAKACLHYKSQTPFISAADTSAVKDQLSATMCDMGEWKNGEKKRKKKIFNHIRTPPATNRASNWSATQTRKYQLSSKLLFAWMEHLLAVCSILALQLWYIFQNSKILLHWFVLNIPFFLLSKWLKWHSHALLALSFREQWQAQMQHSKNSKTSMEFLKK